MVVPCSQLTSQELEKGCGVAELHCLSEVAYQY
jgi:hypothetical protein